MGSEGSVRRWTGCAQGRSVLWGAVPARLMTGYLDLLLSRAPESSLHMLIFFFFSFLDHIESGGPGRQVMESKVDLLGATLCGAAWPRFPLPGPGSVVFAQLQA